MDERISALGLENILKTDETGKITEVDWEEMKRISKNSFLYDEALWMLVDKKRLVTKAKEGHYWISQEPGSIDCSPSCITPNFFYFVCEEDAKGYKDNFYPSAEVRKLI